MTKLTVSYARVSSATQKTDIQVQSFRRADAIAGGAATFSRHYEDKISGAVKFGDRVAGKKLLEDGAWAVTSPTMRTIMGGLLILGAVACENSWSPSSPSDAPTPTAPTATVS
ncbi:MAG: hypothetical protein EXR95_02455, partial [Gemmatimonadetes bacterium]|nr:hypothetical protein [Gemmatimonadota bacterium]